MKPLTLLSFLILFTVSLSAQEYLIDFESSGMAAKIDTVIVKNTTTGATVVLTGDQVLRLKSTMGKNAWDAAYPNGNLTLFPNPMEDYSTLEFETPENGSVEVDLYNGTGMKLAQVQKMLPPGRHSYQVSGINSGIYLVRISVSGYMFGGKLISNSTGSDRASLVYLNSVVNEDAAEMLKNTEGLNTLEFQQGDKLLFTMKSGDYSTTITAIPEADQSIAGNFYNCVDMDNNVYPVVEIGTQVWMAANLKTTKYNDGTPIPNITTTQWANLSSPAYSWRKNDPAFRDPYGALYNWHTVNTGKLCPSGWHVPSEDEYMALESFVGGNSVAGSRLKETGTRHWDSPNSYSDNNSGFSMIGGGYRTHDGGTDFFEFERSGYLWSSTQSDGASAKYRGFGVGFARIDRGTSNKSTGFSVRCLLNEKGPVVNTAEASNITKTSATCQGIATCGPDSHISERGFCWNTGGNPDINSNVTPGISSPDGQFSATLTSLQQNTVYYLRAYASIDGKNVYGNIVSFRTLQESGKLTDFDGNEYKTVTIGTQTWMAENLKTTHFRNGVAIPEARKAEEWITMTSPAFSWRNNNMEGYKNPYGALYNWLAVKDENLCPAGWHTPSESEFKTLEEALGGRAVAGGALKEAGTAHWASPNTGATNSSGFTMLPGGYRTSGGGAAFYELGRSGYLWSSTGWYKLEAAYYWVFSKDGIKSEQGVSEIQTGFSVRCLKNDFVPEIKLPLFTTDTITRITTFSATLQATLLADGGAPLTMKGFCWDTNENPDTSDFIMTATGESTTMILDLNDLLPNTTYHVRAFGINAAGVGYASELVFKTKEIVYGSVTDHEGNQYKTVKIGTQNWMAENLRATTYNDGTAIPLVSDFNAWGQQSTPAYCWYGNSAEYKSPYGALYNWYTAITGKICPSGWHIPTREEWDKLMDYLGGRSVAGGKMKESGASHWNPQADGATNSSGFSALPGGWRVPQSHETGPDAGFQALHESGAWLTASQFSEEIAWNTALNSQYNSVMNGQFSKMEGNSIRCLENDSDRIYGTVADVDGNSYKTVQIGTQTWMAENLKTTAFNDGSPIPYVESDDTWKKTTSPALAWYKNNPVNKDIYGGYYNWYTVDQGNLCPVDWHVPTDNEWLTLVNYLGGNLVAGGKLKETGTLHWYNPNLGATNEVGFSALGAGDRIDWGRFLFNGDAGYWWTSTVKDSISAFANMVDQDFIMVFRNNYYKNIGMAVRCLKDIENPNATIPEMSTDSVSLLGKYTAAVAGTIKANGGAKITKMGVCWSTSANPDTTNYKMFGNAAAGCFTFNLTALMPNTVYYVRSFAVNRAGIGYGNVLSFRTKHNGGNFITDSEGNEYDIVTIGTQTWMAENLKSTRLNDGTPIGAGNASNWASFNGPGYCWFLDNAESFANTYGALYNGYVVTSGKACPAGWHVPAESEWDTLVNYLGGRNSAGGKLKEAGTAHWLSPNAGADNSSQFTALPGGKRSSGGKGGDVGFTIPGYYGSWWTSTDNYPTTMWAMVMMSDQNYAGAGNDNMRMGNSIRCIMGESKPPVSLPRLVTKQAVMTTTTEAASGAVITTDGDGYITSCGLCWSLETDPDTSDFKTDEGSWSQEFKSTMTGLMPDTIYHVRAYAINQAGIAYGNEVTFRTLPDVTYGSVTDIVGNTYLTVKIGTQEWMAENLRAHYFNDATPIPWKLEDTAWAAATSPAISWPTQDVNIFKLYGANYNYYAVQTDKICPAGWRVPSDTDWETLASYLGGQDIAGGKLKEIGTGHWNAPNAGATNEYGFSGRGAGLRSTTGPYFEFGAGEFYWSATQPGIWTLNNENARLEHQIAFGENNGYHVRCMKEAE